jgi:beta-glucuronidase
MPTTSPLRPILSLLLFGASALAQPAPSSLITNIPGRKTVTLDGTWNVIVDPYESGFNSRFYENRKQKDKSELVEYDFDTSGTLKVPGDWNTQRESLMLYEGPVWYQRYFPYQLRPHSRVFLYFGAANYQSRVWLNGKKLGEHVGGFTPFNFEVTNELTGGDNSLVVEVNDARHSDGIPTLSTDWWNYGGITRSVELVELPEVFVQDYSVQLAKGSSDEVSGWVRLNGANTPRAVSIEIPELHAAKSVTTDASGYATFQFAAKPELWTPENPRLYRVVVSSGQDKVEDEIGFRTISTKGSQILLNGKPVFLRGVSIHEEAPFRGGRAFSEEDARTLLGWAKELGAWDCSYGRKFRCTGESSGPTRRPSKMRGISCATKSRATITGRQ